MISDYEQNGDRLDVQQGGSRMAWGREGLELGQ